MPKLTYPVSYIRNSTSSFNADIIGPGAEDMLNRNFREAKTCVAPESRETIQLTSSGNTYPSG